MNNIVITILRVLIFIALLPFTIASIASFHRHLAHYPMSYEHIFTWGGVSFLGAFLFIYQFQEVYSYGQSIMEKVFSFASPFTSFFANIFPFYVLVLMLIYWVVERVVGTQQYDHYCMFFSGFFMAMHILLTAQSINEGQKFKINPTYLFTMSIMVIVSFIVTILLIDLIVGKVTINFYLQNTLMTGKNIFMSTVGEFVGLR